MTRLCLLTIPLSAGLVAPVGAAAVVLHMAPDSSRVEFFITHPISNVRNTAGPAGGEVQVEREAGTWRLSGKATVDLRGLETGIDRRTRHIKSEEFLDVERFPLAEFEFAEVLPDSPAVAAVDSVPPARWKGRARGTLTVHGVARELEVPVELRWAGDRLRVHGKFRMVLADHDIKRPKKFVFEAGKFVDVTIDLLCIP